MTSIEDLNIFMCKEFKADSNFLDNIKNVEYSDLQPKNILKDKIYLITTYWTYPFGGGEEFMYDTMEWASELEMKPYWISFADSKNAHFEEFDCIKYDNGTVLQIPGGFNVEVLRDWLYVLKPDIVHHQGMYRHKFFLATEDLRIEFVSGFHFWSGALILDEYKKNIMMLENASFHKIDPELSILLTKTTCNLYCASHFVKECIKSVTNIDIKDVVYPSSSVKRYKLPDSHDPWESKYVVMINIHKNKGGNIFYELLKQCPNIHFMCVRTEHFSEDLDNKIKTEIEERNKDPNCADSVFMERTYDVKKLYSNTKIMLCTSFVDETFCRVVNEAMMNKIPVLTTHRGNIKYLVGNTTPVLDPDKPKMWVDQLNELYFNETRYRDMSNLMEQKYNDASENVAKEQFKQLMSKVVTKSKNFNVGIFTPWCDQGLGIQSRNYYKILKSSNLFRVFIFALKPYNAKTCLDLQKNPEEWMVDNIYYSPNSREDVKNQEIVQFCRENNIGKMIMPETCWNRVFQIAKLLREIDVKAYAIPNIEIVRRDEIYKHNYFYKVLSNNYLCERIFSVLDIPRPYIGYGIEDIESKKKDFSENTIKYLFIGGMNAFSRKHVLLVCEGFAFAYEKNKNIKLTVTIQMTNMLEESTKNKINKYIEHPGINIMQNHLSYKDIMNLYHTHHIAIQVSKHEGLGLGFYEAVSTGTPVLTLNTPPHNEIILDGINGWTIECYYKKMTDNKDPLFGSAYFDPNIFANKILEISNKNIIQKMITTLNEDLNTRLNLKTFSTRFINELL